MVKVDLKSLKMKDFIVWQKAVQDASSSNDFDKLFALQAQIITEWSYPGDPKDVASYQELTLDDWIKVQKEAAASMTEGFST